MPRGRPPSAKTLVDRQLGRNVKHPILPAGDGFVVPNHSGDHSAGRVDSVPDEELDLVNKEYVDSIATRDVIDLFLTNNASDIANYKDLEIDVITATEETITQAITANSTTLIASFASILNEPEVDEIKLLESGIYDYHAHIETNFGQGMTAFWEFYHRTAAGAETLLGTSHDSPILTSIETEYDLHISITSETAFVAGDRIVAKVYGRNIGNATKNITISMEGDTASRFEFPGFISPGRFLLKDGSNADTTIDINNEDLNTMGRIQIGTTTAAQHPLVVKTNQISGRETALYIEERSGTEAWHIGVEPDGSLGFSNSFSSTPNILFSDTNGIEIGSTPAYSSERKFKIFDDGVASRARISLIGTGESSFPAIEFVVNGNTSKRCLVRMDAEGSSDYGINFFTTNNNSVTSSMFLTGNGNLRMPLDNGKVVWGASQDASIYFDGEDLIINSENVTANDEIHFTNFTKYTFDNDVEITSKLAVGTTALTNQAIGDAVLEGGSLILKEITTPTADTNYGKVYTKTDNKLYFQDGAGTEHELGAGTGANTTLSNLGATAINADLISDTDSTDSLGSTGVRWLKVWTDSIETTDDVTVGGDLIGSRACFTFSDSVGISADDYLFVDSSVQMSATKGFRMHRAGSIIGHSISLNIVTASSGDMTFEVRIAGANQATLEVEFAAALGTGDKSASTTVARNTVTFNAGDIISIFANETGTMSVTDVTGFFEVVFDS